MPTKTQIIDKTVAAIASLDNDEYTLSQVRSNKSLKIYSDLGLGPERRKFCARILNKYIKSNGGSYAKLNDLVKSSDTVNDVISKVEMKIEEGS